MKKILAIVSTLIIGGGAIYFVSNISVNQSNNAITNSAPNSNLGSVGSGNSRTEYITVTNTGINPGMMVGKLEVNESHKEKINDNDKVGILKWVSKNKSDEIRITYSPYPLEAKKLALSIRDFLVSEKYNVPYPENVQLGGGMCEFLVCFGSEGKSIHVN